MGEGSSFIGRFHPLLVHFPIGILWLAFIFELLSRTKWFKKVRFAVQPSLMIGALGAIAAAITGFLLSQEGGYEEKLLSNHQWLGIGTAIFSLLTYLFHRRTFLLKEKQRKQVRVIVFVPLMILLILTGHLGGSLTHGEDFLTPTVDKKVIAKPISVASDSNFYKNIVTPLLEKKCYSCHSSKKQKGQLRLDEVSFILKGGKHGKVLKSSLPNESELYTRLILPPADEHHMPPKDREQLSNAEISLFFGWIEEGASFQKKIGDISNKNSLEYIESLSQVKTELPLDDSSLPELDEKEIAELRAKGIIVMPLSRETKFAKAFFVNPKTITDKEVELLKPFKKNLTDIKFTRTMITNGALVLLSSFENLRSLDLDYTRVTDDGLSHLKQLMKLSRVNLVGTAVSDAGIAMLAANFSLKEIYIFNTKVTKQGVIDFQKTNSTVIIDTGRYRLSVLATDTFVYKRK